MSGPITFVAKLSLNSTQLNLNSNRLRLALFPVSNKPPVKVVGKGNASPVNALKSLTSSAGSATLGDTSKDRLIIQLGLSNT